MTIIGRALCFVVSHRTVDSLHKSVMRFILFASSLAHYPSLPVSILVEPLSGPPFDRSGSVVEWHSSSIGAI